MEGRCGGTLLWLNSLISAKFLKIGLEIKISQRHDWETPSLPYYRPLDSKTSTTTSTRFSLYYVVLAREPASFWRENVVAVVILLRVLARMSKWPKQDIKC